MQPRTTVIIVRLTIACVVIGCVAWCISAARRDAVKTECAHQLQHLGFDLHTYKGMHGSYQPWAVVADDGTPLLSWRVLLAELEYYNVDFKKLDRTKPWDDPKTKEFLRQIGAVFCQCPTVENWQSKKVTYLAVTGPGTFWSRSEVTEPPDGEKELAASKSDPQLVIVEWPWSDIQLAEPRDLTVDEFLAAFNNPDRPTAFHGNVLQYLDADMSVHELPLTSSEAEVRKVLFGTHAPPRSSE